MTQAGPWGNSTGPWSTGEGPFSGGAILTPRGSFMGVTGPGVDVSTAYMNGIDLLGPPAWIRAGWPEFSDSSFASTGSSTLSSSTITALTNEVNRVLGHGYKFHFSGLGVPTWVNSAAGTNGNWKYFPVDAAGRLIMAAVAVQVADVLVARATALGGECAIEWYQEPQIRQFNPGAQSAARWASAMLAVIDAVRAAHPTLMIISGSTANRGDYVNPVPSDVNWTQPAFIRAALIGSPQLAQAAHAPDYWGSHPYVTGSLATDNVPWGTPQMDAMHAELVAAGCVNPQGAPAKVAITEYGSHYTTDNNGNAWTEDDQLTHFLASMAAFNARRGIAPHPSYTGTPYLGGPEEYYVDFNDSKSLVKPGGTTVTKAGAEFKRQTLIGAAVPHADFSYSANGLVVQFTDMSTGSAGTSWLWDFGDGNTSTAHNPSHTYATPDDYIVTFTVTDASTNSDTVTNTVTATGSISPTMDYGPATGVAPLTILAADTTPGSSAWVWDFGDGTPQAFTHDVLHVYANPGTYTLALFVRVGSGTAATTATITVTATENVPTANFGWTPAGGLLVSFRDLSTGSPTSWAWNFGDGSTSTQQYPSHRYATAGTKHVTLTATNANGSNTIAYDIAVSDPSGDDQVVIVEIGVPPTPRTNLTTWVVDDPVRGKIDDQWVLAEEFDWIEVTDDLVDIDTSRKFNVLANRIEPGTATITMRNDNPGRASWYDPENWASPFFPAWPSCRVRVRVDGSYIFGGVITEAPIADTTGNQMVVTINAVEKHADLNQKLRYKPEAIHTAGHRIHRWLECAGSTMIELLEAGSNTYQSGVVFEQTALEAIGDIAFAEGGMFFTNSGGTAYVFLTRETIAAAGFVASFTDLAPYAGKLQYADVVRGNGRDLVFNDATFKTLDDPPVEVAAHDPASDAQYGPLPMPDFTSPIGGPTRAETLLRNQVRVNQVVSDYKDAHTRFESIVIDGMRYTAAQRKAYLTGLDFGMNVEVERHPPEAAPSVEVHIETIVAIAHHVEPNVLTTTIGLQNQLQATGN